MWEDLSWAIRPWGLEMTLPMPSDDDANPEHDPCTKPNFDSSGGYGNFFYMNYILVKSPAEHTYKGEKFDAEIQMGLFRYEGADPRIFGGPVSKQCQRSVCTKLSSQPSLINNYILS